MPDQVHFVESDEPVPCLGVVIAPEEVNSLHWFLCVNFLTEDQFHVSAVGENLHPSQEAALTEGSNTARGLDSFRIAPHVDCGHANRRAPKLDG